MMSTGVTALLLLLALARRGWGAQGPQPRRGPTPWAQAAPTAGELAAAGVWTAGPYSHGGNPESGWGWGEGFWTRGGGTGGWNTPGSLNEDS